MEGPADVKGAFQDPQALCLIPHQCPLCHTEPPLYRDHIRLRLPLKCVRHRVVATPWEGKHSILLAPPQPLPGLAPPEEAWRDHPLHGPQYWRMKPPHVVRLALPAPCCGGDGGHGDRVRVPL